MQDRRLYLVATSAELDRVLDPALAGGVDVVQVRDKDAPDDVVRAAVERFAPRCAATGALFIVNDRPDLASGADGVHVGQDDVDPATARAEAGGVVGLSTRTREQALAADAADLDYFCVGPVWATPTKPGRAPVGLDHVRWAAERSFATPWFAIGGIDTEDVAQVVDAGAQRIVVVRAIAQADDPERAARTLRTAVEAGVGVG